MARNISKRVGWLIGGFAVLVMVEGCAEAPRTEHSAETEGVVGETKDARKDDACAGEAAESDEREPAPIVEDGTEEEQDDQPRPEPVDDEQPELVGDAGMDAALDASQEPVMTAPGELDAGVEASPGDASLAHDTCDSNPCHHAGTCSSDAGSYVCVCPDGYTGQHCELKVCGNITIGSRADVDEHRECAEVRGSLTISSQGLTTISADDFPFLTKISGDLTIAGAQETDAPFLQRVTLANLRAVDGTVAVVGVAVPEFGGSGPLKELHLPVLERLGRGDGSGLLIYQASVEVLDLPALLTIEGQVMLHTLFDLCTVNLERIEHVGGDLLVSYVPKISAAQLEPLRAAVAGNLSESLLGCCASSSNERVACETFTQSARVLYCTGC
jgi:hypothetical protein